MGAIQALFTVKVTFRIATTASIFIITFTFWAITFLRGPCLYQCLVVTEQVLRALQNHSLFKK